MSVATDTGLASVEEQPALLADEIAMLWMCVRLFAAPEQRRMIVEMRRRMGAPELRAFDQPPGPPQ